jgi:hypothetical protein
MGQYAKRAIWFDMHNEPGKAAWEMTKAVASAGLLTLEATGDVKMARTIGEYLVRIDQTALAEFIGSTRGAARVELWEQAHEHHVTHQSREFTEWYRQAGVDPDDYTVRIPGDVHIEQIHGDADIGGMGRGGIWNQLWRQFMQDNPHATKAQIEQFGRGLLTTFKLPTSWARYSKAPVR